MKIGIIVHSRTGHTLSVAQRLLEKLNGAGHSTKIERVIPLNDSGYAYAEVQLKSTPSIDQYDALVICAPVQGGRLSPAMAECLNGIKSLSGKKTACLLTQFFPFSSWGGNQALAQMAGIIQSKGGKVSGSAIVHWSSFRRKQQIADAVNSLSALF